MAMASPEDAGPFGSEGTSGCFWQNYDVWKNDVFKPITDPTKIKKYEMTLFNEWGDLIFNTDEIEEGLFVNENTGNIER